jgi:hypothetical protein
VSFESIPALSDVCGFRDKRPIRIAAADQPAIFRSIDDCYFPRRENIPLALAKEYTAVSLNRSFFLLRFVRIYPDARLLQEAGDNLFAVCLATNCAPLAGSRGNVHIRGGAIPAP